MTHIVALGGTVNPGSSTEQALRLAASIAAEDGAQVTVFGGEYLTALPHYLGPDHSASRGAEMVEAVRRADGLLIAAPGYHGTISGVVKNALDYLEDLSRDQRPYLDGRAVGLIATAFGDQASMSTLLTMRAITHALRGWPTPYGATLLSSSRPFGSNDSDADPAAIAACELVGREVTQFARLTTREAG